MWWHFACLVWSVVLVRIDIIPPAAGVVSWLMMVSVYELVDILGGKGVCYVLSLLAGIACAIRYLPGVVS